MSVPNWRKNAQLFTALTVTDTTVGVFVGTDGDLNVVNVGESTVSVKSATKFRPAKGEPVILTWTNGRLRLTGPVRAKASDGVVVSVNNPYADVTCEGKRYTMPMTVAISTDLKAGDPVVIDWTYRNGYVKDKLTTAGTDNPAEPALTIDQKPFTLYFFAKQSGSRKSFKGSGSASASSRWWTQDVIADDDNVGAWFYGNTIRKSLRDDAFIESVEVYLPARHLKGALPKIGRHTQDKQPNDTVSVQDADTRKARSGWVKLPTEWANAWRNNPGGIALTHGGTNVYKGIQANRQSGKLRIRGRQ